jgi:hypothetical protein
MALTARLSCGNSARAFQQQGWVDPADETQVADQRAWASSMMKENFA